MTKFKFEDVAAALQNPECAALKQRYEEDREKYFRASEEIDRLRGELDLIATLANSHHGDKESILKEIRTRAQIAAQHNYEA